MLYDVTSVFRDLLDSINFTSDFTLEINRGHEILKNTRTEVKVDRALQRSTTALAPMSVFDPLRHHF